MLPDTRSPAHATWVDLHGSPLTRRRHLVLDSGTSHAPGEGQSPEADPGAPEASRVPVSPLSHAAVTRGLEGQPPLSRELVSPVPAAGLWLAELSAEGDTVRGRGWRRQAGLAALAALVTQCSGDCRVMLVASPGARV